MPSPLSCYHVHHVLVRPPWWIVYYSQRIAVVSPTSCFANKLFCQRFVRQCLTSICQPPKSLCQHPTGQFANIRYPVLPKKKAAYWCLECHPDPWVTASHCQFHLKYFRSICMFLIVSQASSWALHRSNFHGENWLLNTKVQISCL